MSRRLALTLRLRLTLLYGGLLAVVAATLLGTAVVVLDRAVRSLPQFPPGVTLVFSDGTSVTAAEFAELVRDSARSELLRSAGLIFLVTALVGVGAAYVLAGRALQPLSRVTATARRLSEETLDERIALDGPPDELKELADTFDAMAARLDAAFDSQRRFVANASHELRTPLAVIRTEVDVTLGDDDASVADLRTMGEVVRDASVRADLLVDALLVLARSEGQARTGLEQREPVDVAELVPRAVGAVSAEASQRCLAVTTETDPAPTEGDPHLLERLVGNLVENAVRHNVDGGWVTVRTGSTSGAGAWLAVANTGAEVPAGDVEQLFQPFRRGGGLGGHRQAARRRLRGHRGDRGRHQLGQVGGLPLLQPGPGLPLAAGQHQQSVHQPVGPDARLPDHLAHGPQLGHGRGRVAEGDVHLGADHRQRRPQLVAGVGDEPALAVEGGVQPGQHRVEGVGQLLELVRRPVQPDPLVQRLLRQPAGGRGDPADRLQRPPGQHVRGGDADQHGDREDQPGRAQQLAAGRVADQLGELRGGQRGAVAEAQHHLGRELGQRPQRPVQHDDRGAEQGRRDHGEQPAVEQGQPQPQGQRGPGHRVTLPRPRPAGPAAPGSRPRPPSPPPRARRACGAASSRSPGPWW